MQLAGMESAASEGDANEQVVIDDHSISTTKCIVNADANLRAGPGTEYEIVGACSPGETVEKVGVNDEGDWCILKDGKWVAGWLLDCAPSDQPLFESIPVVPSP